jgi:hypothetical protein
MHDTSLAPYPPGAFYVAHRLFCGPPFRPAGAWGDVLDGPVTDFDIVVDSVNESFKGERVRLTRDRLRVWFVVPGRAAVDVTDDVLAHAVVNGDEE